MCDADNLPSLTATEIASLEIREYPKPTGNADKDIYQNHNHILAERTRIRQLADIWGVPTNEQGLVSDSVIDNLNQKRKE